MTSNGNPALRAAPRGLKGKETPRLWTRPLRPLNRRTSDGYDVADFAGYRGHPLLPWQRFAAIHGLELNPDGTYRFRIVLVIVARQNGKSDLKREISLFRMYMTPGLRILGLAQEVGLAREQWNLCQDSIHDDPVLAAEFDRARNVNGDEMFWLKNRSRYAIKAASRKSGRGGSNDEVNFDELREQRDWRAWAAVSKTTMARANSQIWCMSNAGDDESVVLNQLRDAALSGADDTIGLFEWSADYNDDTYCDIDDWQQIAQANPGLGHIINARSIASAMATDPPAVFRTEVLCQRVRHIDAAIDMHAWAACADPGTPMDSLRNRVVVCFAVAPDGAHATLAVAAKTRDGKVRGEIAQAWTDMGRVRVELPELLHKIRPLVIGRFPASPSAELSPLFQPPLDRPNRLEDARPGRPHYADITGTGVCEACMGLASLVKGRQVLHNDDPLLNDHIAAASRLKVGDAWRFERRIPEGEDPQRAHVDAAEAFAGACDLALKLPEPRRARIRIIA